MDFIFLLSFLPRRLSSLGGLGHRSMNGWMVVVDGWMTGCIIAYKAHIYLLELIDCTPDVRCNVWGDCRVGRRGKRERWGVREDKSAAGGDGGMRLDGRIHVCV